MLTPLEPGLTSSRTEPVFGLHPNALRPLSFDGIYSWRPELVVSEDGKACAERSLERRVAALAGRFGAAAAGTGTSAGA